MSENNQNEQKRTAGERVADLERGMLAAYQTVNNIVQDLQMIKEAIKLLGNKVDAIVKAANGPAGINDEVISSIMVQNNVDELKSKVANLVSQGILKSEEQVNENSFVVGRELNSEGKVVNPRLQFTLSSLPKEDLREKIRGSKSGDILLLEEGKLKFEVLETYAIVQPAQPDSVEPVVNQTEQPTA